MARTTCTIPVLRKTDIIGQLQLKGGLRDKNVFTVDGDDVHIDDL